MDATGKNLRTFYAIVITQTLSMLGSRMSGLAVGFEVFRQTGEATPLSNWIEATLPDYAPVAATDGIDGLDVPAPAAGD